MEIHFNQVGKKFESNWVIRNFQCSIQPGQHTVFLGANGSGKSTVLKMAMGFLTPTEGEIVVSHQQKSVEPPQLALFTSMAAPYVELIPEFTTLEMLQFQHRFKPFVQQLSPQQVFALFNRNDLVNKPLAQLSSGMRQRVKLMLAILADTPLLVLDEPLSNLDQEGADWYLALIQQYAMHKLILVASNAIEAEYRFCVQQIRVS